MGTVVARNTGCAAGPEGGIETDERGPEADDRADGLLKTFGGVSRKPRHELDADAEGMLPEEADGSRGMGCRMPAA